MPNLRDLMTPEERETMKRWAEERRNPKHKQDIPMPFYIAAQLGYYYGWQAVIDYRRGYSIGYEPELNKVGEPTGKVIIVREAFELEDAVALIEAARKVDYRMKIDGSRIQSATDVSSHDRKYAKKNAEYVNDIVRGAC